MHIRIFELPDIHFFFILCKNYNKFENVFFMFWLGLKCGMFPMHGNTSHFTHFLKTLLLFWTWLYLFLGEKKKIQPQRNRKKSNHWQKFTFTPLESIESVIYVPISQENKSKHPTLCRRCPCGTSTCCAGIGLAVAEYTVAQQKNCHLIDTFKGSDTLGSSKCSLSNHAWTVYAVWWGTSSCWRVCGHSRGVADSQRCLGGWWCWSSSRMNPGPRDS